MQMLLNAVAMYRNEYEEYKNCASSSNMTMALYLATQRKDSVPGFCMYRNPKHI